MCRCVCVSNGIGGFCRYYKSSGMKHVTRNRMLKLKNMEREKRRFENIFNSRNTSLENSGGEPSIKVFSPATIANLVCGFDVLGMALNDPRDIMQVTLTDKPGVSI